MWVCTSVRVECDGTNCRGRVVSCQHLCCASGLQNMSAHSCHCGCPEESHTNRNIHTYTPPMRVLQLILLVACRLYVCVCPGLQLSGDERNLANLGYLRDAFAPICNARCPSSTPNWSLFRDGIKDAVIQCIGGNSSRSLLVNQALL